MYYSASSFGTSRSAIFLATSKTGASGSWTDLGRVIDREPTFGEQLHRPLGHGQPWLGRQDPDEGQVGQPRMPNLSETFATAIMHWKFVSWVGSWGVRGCRRE